MPSSELASTDRKSTTLRRHRPPLRAGTVAGLALAIGGVVITAIAFWWIGVSLPALMAGFEDTLSLLGRMLPPEMPGPGEVVSLVAETLLIAVAGTGLATIASLPLAFAAARSYGSARIVRSLARLITVMTRAVPSLIFAIFFVRAFGLGPLAGGLAIAVHSIGMIAKLVTDAIDEIDHIPSDAIRACGASRPHTAVATIFPRILPALVSIVLYRLDINIRASAILGIVGAGGIGVALQTALGSLDYPRAAGIICVIIALILALELLSVLIRRRVGVADPATIAGVSLPSSRRARHVVGWDRQRIGRFAGVAGLFGIFVIALWSLNPDPQRLFEAWPQVQHILTGMWPPEFSLDIVMGVLETLLMAVGAAVVGTVGGLVLALLTATNVAPWRTLSLVVRVLVVTARGIPDLVYALLFVAALGLGPFAGFLALWIAATALAAKFFTDSIEQLDPVPGEALASLGATRPQALVAAVWPQFVPSFVSNSLFVTDLEIRQSIVLGIVGAGGIGFLLQQSVATLKYGTTSAILLSLLVLIYALEAIAQAARKRLI